MWAAIFVGTGIGAALGALAFPPAGPEGAPRYEVLLVAGIEGMCGGAMLTMIASTVLPGARPTCARARAATPPHRRTPPQRRRNAAATPVVGWGAAGAWAARVPPPRRPPHCKTPVVWSGVPPAALCGGVASGRAHPHR
eukprot:2121866-Prymnesium_polylepis.1